MAFIETVPEDEASGELAELYQADLDDDGFVWNSTRAYSLRPGALHAWEELCTRIKENMAPLRYELVTIAAARRLGSTYCTLAHGKVMLGQGLVEPDRLRDLMVDHHDAGLDEVEVAAMDLADKVVVDATAVTEDDVARLRDLGCSDADILDVILTAGLRCFFSKVVDATGSRADAAFFSDPALAKPADLLAALTVGRPIADP